MTLAEYEKALRALPRALRSDCRYYYYEDYFNKKSGKIEEKSFLDFRDVVFEYRFIINNMEFIIETHFYYGRDSKTNNFYIKSRCQDKKLLGKNLYSEEDYETIRAFFYKEISLDEFLDYFKVDRKIFEKEQ